MATMLILKNGKAVTVPHDVEHVYRDFDGNPTRIEWVGGDDKVVNGHQIMFTDPRTLFMVVRLNVADEEQGVEVDDER